MGSQSDGTALKTKRAKPAEELEEGKDDDGAEAAKDCTENQTETGRSVAPCCNDANETGNSPNAANNVENPAGDGAQELEGFARIAKAHFGVKVKVKQVHIHPSFCK